MPATPVVVSVGDVLYNRIICVQGGQVGQTGNHFRIQNYDGPVPTLADWATAYEVFAITTNSFPVFLNVTASYHGVGCRIINEVPNSIEFFSNALAGPGLGGAHPIPSQVSGLITYRSNVIGGTGRGRSYIPFPAKTDVDDANPDKPTGAYFAGLNAWAGVTGNDIMLPYNGGANTITAEAVIWSKKANTHRFITVALGVKAWATQRRRGDLGRPNIPPI